MTRPLELRLLEDRFAIARLDPAAATPQWIGGELTCVARSNTELSIVCREDCVPATVRSSAGWRCLEIAGPLDLSEVGILSSLAATLADAQVSLFAFSTFDTDYLLVRATALENAIAALTTAGHSIRRDG